MKTCTKCGETKPLSEYQTRVDAKDGRRNACRECVKAQQAAYIEAHRDRLQGRRKQRRDLDGEHVRAGEKSRRDRNPHCEWAKRYRRRARKYGFDVVIEAFTKPDVIERYGDSCFYCEAGAFEELDHYVPVSEGGPHTLANARPSCAKCNKARHFAPKS